MSYLKWKCMKCGDIRISNSNRTHEMNACKCGLSCVDLEKEYSRFLGWADIIEKYNYNFFEELIICMKEQGFNDYVFKKGKELFIDLEGYNKAKQIEDEILEELK